MHHHNNRSGRDEFIRLISRVPFWLALFAIILAWPLLYNLCETYISPYLISEYGKEIGTFMFFGAVAAATMVVFFSMQASLQTSGVSLLVGLADRFFF